MTCECGFPLADRNRNHRLSVYHRHHRRIKKWGSHFRSQGDTLRVASELGREMLTSKRRTCPSGKKVRLTIHHHKTLPDS